MVGLCWGAAIAWVQLRLTWELTGVAGFVRPPQFLSNFLFPPAHWAQFALPEVFLGRPLGTGDLYWGHHGTTPGEACAYVGVVPLILAFVGAVAAPRDRALTPWRLIVPMSLALATMPGWWPDGFFVLLQLPGLGWFRAPARYTLLTSLGLALLAGRGLDHSVASRRFWVGLALAILGGAAAWGWSIHYWAGGAEFQAGLGVDTFPARFAAAGLAWVLGLAAIVAWRQNRLGAWAPMLVAAVELGGLFFLGPVWWRWEIRLPEASPVLSRLADLPDAGLVAGRLLNLPVNAGERPRIPTWASRRRRPTTCSSRRYRRRGKIPNPSAAGSAASASRTACGVPVTTFGETEVLAEIADPALDEVMSSVPNLRAGGLGPWKLVRNRDAFPAAWVARRVREAANWGRLYSELSLADCPGRCLVPRRGPPARVAGTERQFGRASRAGTAARPSSSTTARVS